MSTVDVLEIPKQMGSIEPILPGPALLPSKTKILVEGQMFEVENSPATSSVLGKLQKMEDGSYKLPDDWNVRATQLSTLFDLLHSTK